MVVRAAPRLAWIRTLVALGVLLSLWLPGQPGQTFAQATTGATLTVLAAGVQTATAGGAFGPAQDGQSLNVGDSIRTDGSGVALLTFFDGSEVQLTPSSQVQIQASSQPNRQVSLFQAAGTTVNRVQQLASNGRFQTNTPAAVALVRGTTYLVTVSRLQSQVAAAFAPDALFPRPIGPEGYLLSADVVYRDGTGMWEDRSWIDPVAEATWDTYELIGNANWSVRQAYYVDEGDLWRVRSWSDPASGEAWDTYDNLGPLVGGPNLPRGTSSTACAQNDANACLTSVVLLRDPNGHLGVLGLNSNTGLPPLTLQTACLSGAATARAVGTAPVVATTCNQLQQTTRDLRDVNAARQTQQQASNVQNDWERVLGGPSGGPQGPTPPGGSSTLDLSQSQVIGPSGNPAPARAATPVPATTPAPGPGTPAPQATPAPTTAPSTNDTTDNANSPPPPTAPPPQPGSISQIVGPAGGTVSLPGSGASATFPQNALAGDTLVTIAQASPPAGPPAGQELAGPVYDFSVSSPPLAAGRDAPLAEVSNVFSQPVTITLPYTGTPPDSVVFFNTSTNTWTSIPTQSPDTAHHTITGTTTHFTRFSTTRVRGTPVPLPTVSTVVASPASVPADGESTSTVTVTLKDASGNPVAGKTVTLSAGDVGGVTITPASRVSGTNGQATFSVASTSARTFTLTARDTTDNVTITQTAQVTFRPTNDNFVQAQSLGTSASVTGTTRTATIESGEPTHAGDSSCFVVLSHQYLNSVWYAIAPSQAGWLTLSTANTGTNFDTVLALYTGASLGSLTTVACDNNGDSESPPGSSPQWSSILHAQVQAGQTYYLQLAGVGGAPSGDFVLTSSLSTAAPLTIVTSSLPDATSGTAYSQGVSASGGDAPYTWRVTGLPANLSLSSDGTLNATIGGTPVPAGTYPLAFSVRDSVGRTTSRTINLVVRPGRVSTAQSTVTASPTSVPADGTTPSTITVTLKDGNNNPVPGKLVSLAGPTGWSGTITPSTSVSTGGAGQASFVVTSTSVGTLTFQAWDNSDDMGGLPTVNVTFTSTSPTLTITTSSLPVATAGTAYNGALSATGGSPPYTWGVTGTLPTGISFSTSTGSLSGTATVAGNYSLTFSVTDGSQTATKDLTLVVKAGPVDQAHSSVVASPTSVPADNTTQSTITVTLRDVYNNPVSGRAVPLQASPATSVTIGPSVEGTSDTSGQAVFFVKSSAAGSVTFTASDRSDTLTIGNVTVNFTATSGP